MPRAHALALACDDRASMRPGSRLLEVGKPLGPSLHLHFTAGRNTRIAHTHPFDIETRIKYPLAMPS
ncbi:hypothetical protein JMJ77_0009681, partial [Colletotrichum scovillei]